MSVESQNFGKRTSLVRLVRALRPLGRVMPASVKSRFVSAYLALERRAAELNRSPVALISTAGSEAYVPPAYFPGEIDLVISPNEISFAHGTGVLLSRLMEGAEPFLAMRSRTDYGGEQRINAIATFVLPAGVNDRREIFALVQKFLGQTSIRSILCAPYFETDVQLAIAAQALTGAPLGLWIMDDNCLKTTGIKRSVMEEAFERSSALFAISPELRRTYQTEFRRAFSVLPPLVAHEMVREKASQAPKTQRLVVIGNVWSVDLLDRMSQAVEAANLQVDWFSSNPDLWAGQLSKAKLAKRGVTVIEGDDPKTVADAVLSATAVIVPSDPGNSGGHEAALGAMSLPTRIPFVLATAGTPIIVLGRPGTAAGAFVDRFQIGRVVPYEGAALAKAVTELAMPAEQTAIRKRAASVSGQFSFEGAQEFVFGAIRSDINVDLDRYERLCGLVLR
jgi:hypothetical protein